jgi:hypothetical protein
MTNTIFLTGSLFTWAIIGFLNESSWEYDIENGIPLQSDEEEKVQNAESKYNAMLVHNKTIPNDIVHNPASWWWKYDMVFDCYWGERNHENFNRNNSDVGSKIDDEVTLRKIELDLKRYLAQGIDTLNLFGIQEASRGLLALSQEDPRESDTPFKDNRITDYLTESPQDRDTAIGKNTTTSTTAPLSPDPSILESKSGDMSEIRNYLLPLDPRIWVSSICIGSRFLDKY